MADTQFVWDDLATYKAEGRFLDGYPDDQRTFFSPRDNVHGLLVALLSSAQHSIVVNMFGYDDDQLNQIIQGKLADQKIYVQMSLDRIGAMMHDADLFRAFMEIMGTLALPREVMARPGLMERVMGLGACDPGPPPGPSRDDLLRKLA